MPQHRRRLRPHQLHLQIQALLRIHHAQPLGQCRHGRRPATTGHRHPPAPPDQPPQQRRHPTPPPAPPRHPPPPAPPDQPPQQRRHQTPRRHPPSNQPQRHHQRVGGEDGGIE